MKLAIRIVLPVLLLLTLATAVAMATALPGPTTPYPPVPANPDVCKVEKIEVQKAQLEYDAAVRQLERVRRAFDQGAASRQEVRNAERAVLLAMLKLNNAKYAEAKCRNQQGNDPNKACIALALELNRLLDELAIRQSLEQLAREEYDALLAARPAVSEVELDRAETAWRLAQLERQQVEQRIADLRAQIAADPNCRTFPTTRPTTTTTTPPTTTTQPTTPPTTAPAGPTASPAEPTAPGATSIVQN